MRPAFSLASRIAYSARGRRHLSATACRCDSKTTAAEAASQLLETFSNSSVIRRQVIDGNQLQKLSLTLGRRRLVGDMDVSTAAPPVGTPVPHGYHLVYFTPDGVESELGADGTDRTFNAPAPYTRRMWAGGKMTWPAGKEPIRVGDEVEERTTLVGATAKKSRNGGEMVLVDVEKEYWGPRGLSFVDRRSWIFRPEIDLETTAAAPPPKEIEKLARGASRSDDVVGKHGETPLRRLSWSSVGLFRFSALTFNGHMIHYNQDWTKNVEGHPGLVVHGPINLISMLDYWRDVHGNGESPREITYRALSPIYAGEIYDIKTAEIRASGDGRAWDIVAEKDGVVCMKGEILG